MHPILSALETLLPDEALRLHMNERRFRHVSGGTPFDSDAVVTLDTLEQAFARGAILASNVRVFGAYDPLDLEKMGAVRNDRVRPLTLRKLARQGCTVVVNNLQNLTPSLWELACGLERRLGSSLTLAAVVSFGQSGIKLHYDHGDLIILQLDGAKRWSFYGDPVDGSAPRFCNHRGELPTEVTNDAMMRPGDIMFVPSGLFHQCTPESYSLHLGIILRHPTATDFADHVANAMRATAGNEPLNGFLGDAAIAGQEADLKARLIAQIEATDLRAWLAEWRSDYARVGQVDLRGSAPARETGTVAFNVSLGPELTTNGRWRSAGAEVRSTPPIDALVQALSAGPCTIAALTERLGPAHANEAVATALEALRDAGLVRILPDPAAVL